MSNKKPSKPTGKSGRGVPARTVCCVCQGTREFRVPSTGRIVDCTNC